MADNPTEVMYSLDDDEMSKDNRSDLVQFVVQAIDSEIGDAYSYSGSDLYRQMGEAWRRYYQRPFGSEEPGYSQYVSGMLAKHVNQSRAFVVNQLNTPSMPIIKFRPVDGEDTKAAEAATEFTNHVFWNKLKGGDIIDKCVFNAALLKMCPTRVYLNEIPQGTETYEYEFEGSAEDFNTDFAEFQANTDNEQLLGQEPAVDEFEIVPQVGEDGQPLPPREQPTDLSQVQVKVRKKWDLKLPDNKEIAVDVISPGSFFVSRQAESLEDARLVAQIALERIGDLKRNYPDAAKLNDMEDDEEGFWQGLQSEYIEWFRETEWLEKWAYDTLGISEQEDGIQDTNAGTGAKEIFVMDAEMYFGIDKDGKPDQEGEEVGLFHVVKAGGYVLKLEQISERSFVSGSLIPTGTKWVGLSIYDLINYDLREESTLMRAFSDAALEAAHPHAIVDPMQIDPDEVEDLQPGTLLWLKDNRPDTGKPAVEFARAPTPDAGILQAAQAFKDNASQHTGVGTQFGGATVNGMNSLAIGEGAIKQINSVSDMVLNYYSRTFTTFLAELLVKIWNTAVLGGVTAEVFHTQQGWQELSDDQKKARSAYVLNIDVGVNEKQEKAVQAQAVSAFMEAAVANGVQLLPQAGYEWAKTVLEANGIMNVNEWVVDPKTQQGFQQDPQLTAFLNNAQAQMQQGLAQQMEQAIAAERERIMTMPESQYKLARAELARAQAGQIVDNQEHTEQNDAIKHALAQKQIESDEDQNVANNATKLTVAEIGARNRGQFQ